MLYMFFLASVTVRCTLDMYLADVIQEHISSL